MIISEGLLCRGEEGKGVYSEQGVNNALLMSMRQLIERTAFV